MSVKSQRQAAILELVRSGKAASQQQIAEALKARGFDVSQTTVSRDIAELGLARRRGKGGPRYSEPGTEVRAEESDGALRRVARESLLTVEATGNIVVVKTKPGNAQGLAWAIDAAALPGVAGTVGGDDTIIVICSRGTGSQKVGRMLMNYALENG